MRRMLIVLAATSMMVGAAAAQTAATTTTETFVTAKPTDVLSYNIINLNVTNNANETIGEIKDLILSQDQLTVFSLPFLLYRTITEDRILRAELAGYSEYAARVRWRLLPAIW